WPAKTRRMRWRLQSAMPRTKPPAAGWVEEAEHEVDAVPGFGRRAVCRDVAGAGRTALLLLEILSGQHSGIHAGDAGKDGRSGVPRSARRRPAAQVQTDRCG